MKRIAKSHAFIGMLSIIMGILVSFVLTPIYSEALEKKDEIVRVKKMITAGSKITDEYLEIANVGVFNLSDKIIRDKNEVIGKYAKTTLYPGMYPVKDSLSDAPIKKDLYLNDLPKEKYAISVTVQNYAAGLSSKLLQGDIVSVVVKRKDDDGMTLCEIPESLMYIEVLSTTEENGVDKSAVPDVEVKNKEKSNERLATVTLLANLEQVSELSGYEGEAVIHLALKSRNNPQMKEKLLKIQDKYFEELDKLKENEEILEENSENKDKNIEEIKK